MITVKSEVISLDEFRRLNIPITEDHFSSTEIQKKSSGSLAARYLLKKILSESYGGFPMKSVEIINDTYGKPEIHWCGLPHENPFTDITLCCSVSHSKKYAAVMLVSQDNS